MDNASASGDVATPSVERDTTADNGWSLGAEWRQGFEQSRRHERQRFLSQAREMFGDPLAEVILTHDPEHLIGLTAAAATMSDAAIEPLRNAVNVANDLTARADVATIRAWFVGLNDMLDDQEPALVIKDDLQAVRDAARAYLAYG